MCSHLIRRNQIIRSFLRNCEACLIALFNNMNYFGLKYFLNISSRNITQVLTITFNTIAFGFLIKSREHLIFIHKKSIREVVNKFSVIIES